MDESKTQRAHQLNGEMFRLGRQFRGLTQREFAEAIGAEPSGVSRIENGIIQPSPELAERASAKLDLPLAFFSQPERPYGLPISVHPMWRAKASVSQHSVDQCLAELNLRIIHVRRLLRPLEYEPVTPLPEIDADSQEGGPEAIAGLVRRAWLMPAGPVHDLISWVERAGCFVMFTEMPDAAMSGVTLRVPDMQPCIFLNKNMPTDRMRHTLAHELGHLIMHRYPSKDMEDEANAFASAFLMPAHDIRAYFAGKKIDLRLLATLKPEWRVAMQSLLYRATTLGYVNDSQARYLWQQFSIRKWRLREPPELDLQPEAPTLVNKLLALHMERLGYTLQDLAAVTALHPTETARMYGLNQTSAKKPSLRVVS
jgi:Zn-dependent peptidase ImmA (M78 family)/transcriptional regulator with XRE-family HTH domain